MRLAAIAALLIAGASPAAAAQDTVSIDIPDSVPSDVFSGDRSREVMMAQILLDRTRFSPGVIDGYVGGNTRRAIRAYQRANDMEETGVVSDELLRRLAGDGPDPLLQTYKITEDDVDGPFVDVPSEMEEMAELDELAYADPQELLAEKFHMDEEFLRALNPGVDFGRAGTEILVAAPGGEKLDGNVARIEVDKEANSVRAYDSDGKLLARYPATVGSSTFPSPSGEVEVVAVAPEPKYYFDPEGREWGPDAKLTIPAGPNNPIGGTWIDLSKEGYGIHGSPDPHLIGKTASHGCVRLTNWDAEELGGAVNKGTTVEFV